MDGEGVLPAFGTGFPLPSTAEVMVVAVGGCTDVVVEITETVLKPLLVTYISLLAGLNAMTAG
jgi:hypothetical protein